MSAAQRAKDDTLELLNDSCAALQHLKPHLPELSDSDKAELRQAITDHIGSETEMNDLLDDEPWREAAE
jgi:hypothetical protein